MSAPDLDPGSFATLGDYLLATHAALPEAQGLDAVYLSRMAIAIWDAAHPELLAAKTDSQFAAVALAVLALVHVAADLSERLEAARALSAEFDLPWPPYPGEVEEEDDLDLCTICHRVPVHDEHGYTVCDACDDAQRASVRLPDRSEFVSLEAFAAEARRLNPDLAMGEHVEFLSQVARAWGAA